MSEFNRICHAFNHIMIMEFISNFDIRLVLQCRGRKGILFRLKVLDYESNDVFSNLRMARVKGRIEGNVSLMMIHVKPFIDLVIDRRGATICHCIIYDSLPRVVAIFKIRIQNWKRTNPNLWTKDLTPACDWTIDQKHHRWLAYK